MKCPQCQTENLSDAAFCEECGAPLEAPCPTCGAGNRPTAKFCRKCRAPLTATPAAAPAPRAYTPKHLADKILTSRAVLEGERKQVTVLFADVKGSMEMAEQMDAEEWSRIMNRFFQILSDSVERFEGFVDKFTGDGIMALFGAPVAHEDHARRACYAALHMVDGLRSYANELRLRRGLNFSARLGLNSGEVIVGKIGDDLRMDYTAQGHTVGLASRMEQIAEPGKVYLTAHTAAQVEGYFALADLGEMEIKGVQGAMHVYELTGLGQMRTRFDVSRSRGFSRFVGRGDEMQVLESALARAREGNAQVVGIVGDAGLGKSRLCFEFLERCRTRGVMTYETSGVAHGKAIPFLPILRLFRAFFGITEQDSDTTARERIAGRLLLLDERLRESLPLNFDFMGVPDPENPPPRIDPEARQRQMFDIVRRVVQARGQKETQVSLLEDLHWFDGGSAAFLEPLIDAAVGTRLLVLVTFRPEYQAPWMGKSYYHQLALAPLGPEAIRELVDALLGKDPSTARLADAIHARTLGNPFFTEEVVQNLIESGKLQGSKGAYRLVTPVDKLEVPSSVHAILAARIDRLAMREKDVLQTAAVIGREFDEPTLAAVVEEAAPQLREAMQKLKDTEFVYEQSLYPVAEYIFKHPLTQEVALASQLQERRKRLHAAVARVIEAAHAKDLDQQAALLAHHWEEAGETVAAARWHRRAAERVGLNDIKAALHHWQRVRELARQVGDGTEATALTILACSQALSHGWRMGAAATEWAELFEEGCAAAERAENLAALAKLYASYGAVRGHNLGIAYDWERYAGEAVQIGDCTGDAALHCQTRFSLMFAHSYCGQLREAERIADVLIELAHEDPHFGADVAGSSPLLAAQYVRLRCVGYMRDPATSLRELPLVRQFALDSGYPEEALWMLAFGAELKYAFGSPNGMCGLAQAAARLAENLGVGNEITAADALCHALASEREWQALLDAAGDTLRLIRDRGALRLEEPTYLAYIGTAHLELSNPEAGRAAAQEGVVFMRESKSAWNPHSYAVLARAQLALGEPAADIERTLDEYAALLERTEFHLFQGELHELRARLADREGRHAEKAAALQRAYDCYTSFGMVQQAARVAEAKGR
jgi:class 3 adenylate cyclase